MPPPHTHTPFTFYIYYFPLIKDQTVHRYQNRFAQTDNENILNPSLARLDDEVIRETRRLIPRSLALFEFL